LLSATVAASSGSVTHSGTVSFSLGQQQIVTATLTGGKASLSLNQQLPAGTYSLTATYHDSSEDDPSTSAPVTIAFAPIVLATTTTLSIHPHSRFSAKR